MRTSIFLNNITCFKIILAMKQFICYHIPCMWLVGQAVKTLPSHGRISGSIPLRAIICILQDGLTDHPAFFIFTDFTDIMKMKDITCQTVTAGLIQVYRQVCQAHPVYQLLHAKPRCVCRNHPLKGMGRSLPLQQFL